jgi:hypothetical protein
MRGGTVGGWVDRGKGFGRRARHDDQALSAARRIEAAMDGTHLRHPTTAPPFATIGTMRNSGTGIRDVPIAARPAPTRGTCSSTPALAAGYADLHAPAHDLADRQLVVARCDADAGDADAGEAAEIHVRGGSPDDTEASDSSAAATRFTHSERARRAASGTSRAW